MTPALELASCPFCGEDALVEDCSVGWFAYCPNEECFVQPETGAFTNKADAVAKWNRRTHGEASEVERLRAFAETVPDNAGGGCPWCLASDHWAGRVETCSAPSSRAITAALSDRSKQEE
jgi:hypothetical protein